MIQHHEDIRKAVEHIQDDELVELPVRVVGKLESMSDCILHTK